MSKKCPFCGEIIPDDSVMVCPNCQAQLPHHPRTVRIVPASSPAPAPTPEPAPEPAGNNKVKIIIIVVVAVLVLLGGFLGLFFGVIRPKMIDNKADRFYTFAPSVIFRSSMTAGTEYNKLGSLPYGTELITYENDPDWSAVKVKGYGPKGKDVEGYVASDYILEKRDFFLLNSIFGDEQSKEVINTSKCRRALLEYYKNNNYIGRISREDCEELELPYPQQSNQWQIFCNAGGSGSDNVFYKRLVRSSAKYTDFAVILRNTYTGDRKLVYFYFDDDETPHFLTERAAPKEGTITYITLNYSKSRGLTYFQPYYSTTISDYEAEMFYDEDGW